MKLGFRARLIAVSIAIICVFSLVSGLLLEREIRQLLDARITDELVREARISRELLFEGQTLGAQALAARIGGDAQTRVTIIDPDGRVIGDSEVPTEELPGVENHATRPEVAAALAGPPDAVGVARRKSATVGHTMLYVAVPFRSEDGVGALRLSVPLASVDLVVHRLRVMILLAGLLGLVVAVFMSGLASQLVSRDLMELVRWTRNAAGGQEQPRDEVGGIAMSFRRLASDLEAAVAELASERNRLEAVMSSMRDGLLALDEQGRVSLLNPAARRLLGVTGASVGVRLLEAARLPALDDVARSAMEGENASVELDLPAPLEPARALRVQVLATPQSGGGCVLTLRDVTELRHLETVRRDFVANVSHELRTPVTTVRASAEALQDGAIEDPELAADLVEGILRNAMRLTALINDLLSLSRLEAGHYNFLVETVAAGAVARRVCEGMTIRARARGQTLTLSMREDLLVMADGRALEQILTNLTDNALKYTPEGGTIEVAGQRIGGLVRLEVRDDGLGVPGQHRARVFERFYRVDPGRSRDEGGTGLGLAIVKHLAESMGGQVGLSPRQPRGSVFWVSLPAG